MLCSTTNTELPEDLSWSMYREEGLGVGRMQAGRGLVQHVDHAEEAGAQLGGDPEPLHLAGGECGGGPAQREVAQTEVQ